MLNYRDIIVVVDLVTQGLRSIPWSELGSGLRSLWGESF